MLDKLIDEVLQAFEDLRADQANPEKLERLQELTLNGYQLAVRHCTIYVSNGPKTTR